LTDVNVTGLAINYRTPAEVMAEAEPVIRSVLPDANVPISVRTTGIPVRKDSFVELDGILGDWLDEHREGTACVIGDVHLSTNRSRVRVLTAELAKGLEFDLVVLVDPMAFGDGVEGVVDRYVAMTRATQQLVILTSPERKVHDAMANSPATLRA
jgi:DNA helicase IV